MEWKFGWSSALTLLLIAGQATDPVHAQAVTTTTATVVTSAAVPTTSTQSAAIIVGGSSTTTSLSANTSSTASNATTSSTATSSSTATGSVSVTNGQTTLSGGGTPLGSGAATTAPATRFGAAAHLIWDQAVAVFIGGLGGTWNLNAALSVDASIAVLSLHSGFTAGIGGGSWLTAPSTTLVDAPATAVDPRLTSYAASAIARSVDVNVAGANVDLFFYLFGDSDNPTTSAVYLYDPAAPSEFYSFNDHVTAASPRIRAASCLLDSETMLIHGGLSGPDNSPTTITLQDTYLLNLVNSTTSNNAWTSKTSSIASDPYLHDHVMECVEGVAYMLSGITADENSDGTLVASSMSNVYVYTYDSDITAGSWTKHSTIADPENGSPPPRRSATLTAVSSTSNILLLHGGVQVDLDYTYKDLWQLDTSTFQWKQLTNSPYLRHSHNAFMVNNYLVAAFGVVSNNSDPNPPIPGIVAYDVSNNVWGNLPGGITAQTPPALPTHTGSSDSQTSNTPSGGSGIILSTAAIAGIAAGGGAIIIIVIAAIILRRKRIERDEQKEIEQKMNERLRREDMDRELALQGILGSSAQTPMGRQVGGELARVIQHNLTGVRSVEPSTDDDSLTSDADDPHVFKFGPKEQLNDERKRSKYLAPPSVGNRHSYVSGTSGVSYPSGSGISRGGSGGDIDGTTTTDDDDDDDELQTTSTRPNSQAPGSPELTAEKEKDSTSVKKKLRASIIDVVSKRSSSSRNGGNFKKDEPLRPWELPGMGTIKSPSATRSSAVSPLGNPGGSSSGAGGPGGGRLSQNSQIDRSFLSPDQRSFSPAQSDMYKTGSRYSMNSSVQSGASGGEQFDESQYMRSLFAQFTDAQILESWNSYVAYTGQIYTLQQIVALRAIYGKDNL
ncbi:hypothetical protein HK100_011393 [Physocladia obscura]|uniref:Galactose oxidase n=1 Tax=Physocladia obscura TaxID=109957 RepID=A0AAD5XMX5_9FUNG|nr:hypothetical protein HK100_011393 [Physocladia obscura]